MDKRKAKLRCYTMLAGLALVVGAIAANRLGFTYGDLKDAVILGLGLVVEEAL